MLNGSKNTCLMLGMMVTVLALGACSSGQARRIDPGGTETVVSLNKIDIQDWMDAAETMIGSLTESGVLTPRNNQPAVIAISRIVNNTTQQINTSMLTKKIRISLNKSGKAVTTTTIALGGRAEDPLAQGELQRAEFFNDGDKPAVKEARPDFTLSGSIIEDRAKSGRTRQTTYVFQLSLTNVRNGLAVWEDEKQITKQGKRNSLGW